MPINPGLPVSIYSKTDSSKTLLSTIYTDKTMLPGEIIFFEYEFIPTEENKFYTLAIVADDKGNGTGEYNECNESDNTRIITFKGIYSKFCKVGKGECTRFAPYTCNEAGELSCNAKAGNPKAEKCDDGLDNNCDGQIDENCSCNSGETSECYRAASNFLLENSVCKKGSMICIGGENWSECKNDILPSVESCNGKDDDCDGEIDEDFQALGKNCSVGFGICKKSGNYVCDDTGNMICDAIALDPQLEKCNDGLDNNCNGQVDERPCQE